MCAGLHVTRHSIVVKNFLNIHIKWLMPSLTSKQSKPDTIRDVQVQTGAIRMYMFIYVYI